MCPCNESAGMNTEVAQITRRRSADWAPSPIRDALVSVHSHLAGLFPGPSPRLPRRHVPCGRLRAQVAFGVRTRHCRPAPHAAGYVTAEDEAYFDLQG